MCVFWEPVDAMIVNMEIMIENNPGQLTGIRRYADRVWIFMEARVTLFAIVLYIIFSPFTVFTHADTPTKDLLYMPAVRTHHPEKGLLLDITRAGNRIVAVGENGRIVFSDDHGKTWIQANVPVCVTLTTVSFPMPEKGWAAGHDGVILHSGDGGKSWFKQIDGTHVNERAFAQVKGLFDDKSSPNPDSPAAEFDEMDWMDLEICLKDMAFLVAEGATWPFMDIRFSDEFNGIAVGAFGMAVETVDGGKTWHPFLDRLLNPIGLHYYGIDQVGNDLFLVGEMGLLLRSEDNGKTWHKLTSPYEGTFFGVSGTSLGAGNDISRDSSHDQDTVIIFGLRGNAFRSMDRGLSWQTLQVPSGAAWMSSRLLSDGSFLLTSPMVGGVMSSDNGRTFSLIPRFPLAAMAVVETADGRWVTAGAMGIQIAEK